MKNKIRFPQWNTENIDHNDPKIKMIDEMMTMEYDELVGIAEAEDIDYTEGMDKYDLVRMLVDAYWDVNTMKIDVRKVMQDNGKLLESLPNGTRITGVYSKHSGMEAVIEKRSGYRTGWDLNGLVGRVAFTEWTVFGYADPYIKSTLRGVLDGTSKYYELHD